MAYEFWKNAVRTTHEVFAMYELCENRGSLWRRFGRAQSVLQRQFRCRSDQYGLRTGCDDYGLMPVAVSMGTIFSHQ